jgi:hypothetical protein
MARPGKRRLLRQEKGLSLPLSPPKADRHPDCSTATETEDLRRDGLTAHRHKGALGSHRPRGVNSLARTGQGSQRAR